MRGVPIDLTGRPILKRVVIAAIVNLMFVIVILATGIGRSPVADAEHSMKFGQRSRQYYRPVVVHYVKASLLVFIGTMLFTGISARRT